MDAATDVCSPCWSMENSTCAPMYIFEAKATPVPRVDLSLERRVALFAADRDVNVDGLKQPRVA